MTEAYEKPVFENVEEENEYKLVKKTKKKVKAKKADKSLGISNPRYYENARTPKKAKNAYTLKKVYSLNFGF
jgi:hypothetical protein